MSVRSFKRARARRVEREQRRFANAKRRGALAAGAALTASALFAANAEAASYMVNTNADDAPGGTCGVTCTLRDAISTADKDSTADTINFDPSLNGKTITLTTANGPLTISHSGGLAINGPGAGSLAVSGNNGTQVFDITSPSGNSESISGLTIENGSTSSPGGAIENANGTNEASSLTLTNDTVTGSTTTKSSSYSGGGGVYSHGPLTVTGSTISENHADSASGGGINSYTSYGRVDSLNISATTITGNTARSGGGVFGGNYDTITNSQITGNHANAGSGGGVFAARVGKYLTTNALNVSGSTVSQNTSTSGGGGMFAQTKYGTTISNSSISGNTAIGGGGLTLLGGIPGETKYNPVVVENTTIGPNQAYGPNQAQYGAGIEVAYSSPGSPIDIKDSTVSGNQGGANSFGGGLLVDAYVYSPFKVVDSTISGNGATKGGGVSLSYNGNYQLLGSTGKGSIAFDNSTIASNAASSSGGGIYLGQYKSGGTEKSGTAGITSTIVAGNTASGSSQDLSRGPASTSGGFNGAFSLIQQPDSAPLTKQSVIVGVSPQLGALGNNGGPTHTMLPSGTSPVIDQGHAPHSLTTDQRGGPRTIPINGIKKPPGGDGTDIGSVELSSAQVVANFSASVPGGAIDGPKAPLLAARKTPVKCAVRTGTLSSCVIQVLGPKGGVLAQGGTATQSPTATSLSPTVRLTAAGVKALKHHALGRNETIKVFGNTGDDTPTIVGKVHLSKPEFTLPLPANSSTLPKKLRKQLNTIANLLFGAKSATCTGYAPSGGSVSLAKSQGQAACGHLKSHGFAGKVHSRGKTHTGGPQLVITFKY